MNKKAKEYLFGFLTNEMKAMKNTVKAFLRNWDEYFKRLDIKEEKQLEEIKSIIRMRVDAGKISIVAPDIDKVLSGKYYVK